jgi:hypothetical protein
MHLAVLHAAFAFDQIRHAPARPKPRVVSQRFRTPLEAFDDLFPVGIAQFWLSSGPARLPERFAATRF